MNLINSKINSLIKVLNKNKYSKILIDILVDGKIPYFNFIKKYLIYISLFSLIIFIDPKLSKDFGENGINLLLIILFISPLSKIIPKFKILDKFLILRRPIGIIIGSFILAHLIGFIILNNIDIIFFLKKNYLDYQNQFFWGIWGTIFMFLPFITSNNLSQKILKNKWKMIQQLTYFFFIFGSIHIFLTKGDFSYLLLIFIWLLLKFLAYKKIVIIK